MIKYNTRPSYFVEPYWVPGGNKRRYIAGRFSIMEYNNGEINFCFSISKMGLQLNDILKRGIPYDDAKNLFYKITS